MTIYVRDPNTGNYVELFDPNIFTYLATGQVTIKDKGITFAKLADDAQLKIYRYTSGFVAVPPKTESTLVSVSIPAGTFKKGFIIIAICESLGPSTDCDKYRLYVDGTLVDSNDHYEVYGTGYYYRERFVLSYIITDTNAHTIALKYYNSDTIDTKYYRRGTILIIGL